MGTEDGHFENFLLESSNSETMLQKVCVHNCFILLRGGEEYPKNNKKEEDLLEWLRHARNCLLKHVIEGKIVGRRE
jgi:hypothetical protein